jgi:DNA modification methylase
MAVKDQVVTDRFAIYNTDSLDMLRGMPSGKVGLSVYSPPFATSTGALYTYSSSERDLSNSGSYKQFFQHYRFFVQELARVTMPGRISCVHCTDVPLSNSGKDALRDFPGDIIKLHKRLGFDYAGSHYIWKEPLAVRNRTMQKNLAHATIVSDSTLVGVASADRLLVFRNRGDNPVPVAHPTGLYDYAGERRPPADLLQYRGWAGKQTENRWSHWIWRQYASSFWDDIRIDRVLPFRQARDSEDERHVHPLQLDVIHRCVVLRSNPGDIVVTPFMGVGSEVYEAVRLKRFGVGGELKPSYFRQAVKNMARVDDQEDANEELDLAAVDKEETED